MPIPLYGFLRGDTLGLLILAQPEDTLDELAGKLQRAADLRVPRKGRPRVRYKERWLDTGITVAQAGMEPLERFDVVQEEG